MTSKKEYYFIRHAVPINDIGSFHLSVFDKDMLGEVDEPLSDKGVQQASALKKTIKKLNIQCIVSSTMKRAIETAMIISSETGIPYNHQFEKLVEVALGNHPVKQNTLFKVLLSKRWPRKMRKLLDWALSSGLTIYYFLQWRRGKTTGGESSSDIYLRIDEMLKILDSFSEERIVIVGHSGWISFLSTKILGESLWNFLKYSWVDNCYITRIDSNGNGAYQLRFFSKSHESIP